MSAALKKKHGGEHAAEDIYYTEVVVRGAAQEKGFILYLILSLVICPTFINNSCVYSYLPPAMKQSITSVT
jgi:hypothetical protein